MLEISKERVELLKAGNTGRTIEKLYIIYNGFKIINSHVLFEPDEVQKQLHGTKYEFPVKSKKTASNDSMPDFSKQTIINSQLKSNVVLAIAD